MKHYLQLTYDEHRSCKTIRQTIQDARNEAVEFFMPDYPDSSLELQVSVSKTWTIADGKRISRQIANVSVTYDTEKDVIGRVKTGGKSIPVPSY